MAAISLLECPSATSSAMCAMLARAGLARGEGRAQRGGSTRVPSRRSSRAAASRTAGRAPPRPASAATWTHPWRVRRRPRRRARGRRAGARRARPAGRRPARPRRAPRSPARRRDPPAPRHASRTSAPRGRGARGAGWWSRRAVWPVAVAAERSASSSRPAAIAAIPQQQPAPGRIGVLEVGAGGGCCSDRVASRSGRPGRRGRIRRCAKLARLDRPGRRCASRPTARSTSAASARASWTIARSHSAKVGVARRRDLLGGVGVLQRLVEIEQLQARDRAPALGSGRCGAWRAAGRRRRGGELLAQVLRYCYETGDERAGLTERGVVETV